MKQIASTEKVDTVSQLWHAIKELQFISSFFSWFFMLLSRLAEPCMLLAVLYVVIEAGIPVVATATLHNLAVAVMIAAPEIILPGAFVISKQAKEHGQENRPLLAICWLFVCLTLITLVSLFVLHLDREVISIIMCVRCAAGVGYSILVRMLSYKGLTESYEPQQIHTQQPAPLVLTPELLQELRVLLTQTTVSEERPETPQITETATGTDTDQPEIAEQQQRVTILFPIVPEEDRNKVIEAFKSGIPRREICAYLKWGNAKYSTIVKPVLDSYEQQAGTQ
jgi:hypothetical protein